MGATPKSMWTRPRAKEIVAQTKPVLDEATKHTQALRVALNKLSVKNYAVQKKIIFDALSWFVAEGEREVGTIAPLLFEIVAGNVFFNEIYCNMYVDVMTLSPVFRAELDARLLAIAARTRAEICDIDAADYDRVCAYNTEKANRKAAAAFYGSMGNRRVVSMDRIRDVVTTLRDAAVEASPSLCEEIVDLLCVFIGTCGAAKDNLQNADWVLAMDAMHALRHNATLTKKSQISLLNAIDCRAK